MKFPKIQTGFTLLEVLVALIVVAIGLLGLAKLQAVGLRNSNSNYLMQKAIWLANDIMDRARSNIIIQNDSGYTSNYVNKINGDTMAVQDLQEWQRIISELPNVSITLCTTNIYGSCKVTTQIQGTAPYMIKLQWDDPAQSDGRQTLIMMFQVDRKPNDVSKYLGSYK